MRISDWSSDVCSSDLRDRMANTNHSDKMDKLALALEKQVQKQSQIKVLIALGKEKGYLTYAEVADHLPEIVDTEQIEDIISMIQAMGIKVHEEAPTEDEQLFSEPAVVARNEAEEAHPKTTADPTP